MRGGSEEVGPLVRPWAPGGADAWADSLGRGGGGRARKLDKGPRGTGAAEPPPVS